MVFIFALCAQLAAQPQTMCTLRFAFAVATAAAFGFGLLALLRTLRSLRSLLFKCKSLKNSLIFARSAGNVVTYALQFQCDGHNNKN